MNCQYCGEPQGCEHRIECPMFEPRLTQEEIRALRRLLRRHRLYPPPAESVPKYGG